MKSVDTLPLEESAIDRILYELDAEVPFAAEWRSSTHTFFRFSAPTDETAPIDRLQTSQHEKIYWRDRNGTRESAGIGVADSIMGESTDGTRTIMQAIQERTRNAPPNVRYYGGMRFRHDTTPDTYWSSFGGSRFILPFVEYVKEGGEYYCHCTLALPHGSSVEEARAALRQQLLAFKAASQHAELQKTDKKIIDKAYSDEFSPSSQADKHTDTLRTDTPNKQGWKRSIEEAVREFNADRLEKVVLARRVTLDIAERPNAVALLKERAAEARRSTLFLFDFGNDAVFFGATPEYLYRREGRTIATEAIAGTRKRGADEAEDIALGNDLLFSDKERREHASVQRYVASGLDDLTESFDIGKVELLKLSGLQHLYAPFTGRLRTDSDDAAIIERLHPTPAVGGTPRREALEFLRREGFDRGWYAAPVGWVNAHAAEFVVALRSALITDTLAHLFSGAGIVKGSESDAEWNEIEMKIAPMLELFAPQSA